MAIFRTSFQSAAPQLFAELNEAQPMKIEVFNIDFGAAEKRSAGSIGIDWIAEDDAGSYLSFEQKGKKCKVTHLNKHKLVNGGDFVELSTQFIELLVKHPDSTYQAMEWNFKKNKQVDSEKVEAETESGKADDQQES